MSWLFIAGLTMMPGMEWLVSAGLMVAVAAWVAGVCHRLQMLRAEVREAWADWLEDTRRRNDALGEFAESASVLLPPGEMLPRTLRRMVADSERSLRMGEHLLWTEDDAARVTETSLYREASAAARLVEQTPQLRDDEGLGALCEGLLRALERQEQSGHRLNLAAEAYNAALREPPVEMIAPVLGFLRIAYLFSSRVQR